MNELLDSKLRQEVLINSQIYGVCLIMYSVFIFIVCKRIKTNSLIIKIMTSKIAIDELTKNQTSIQIVLHYTYMSLAGTPSDLLRLCCFVGRLLKEPDTTRFQQYESTKRSVGELFPQKDNAYEDLPSSLFSFIKSYPHFDLNWSIG